MKWLVETPTLVTEYASKLKWEVGNAHWAYPAKVLPWWLHQRHHIPDFAVDTQAEMYVCDTQIDNCEIVESFPHLSTTREYPSAPTKELVFA